MKAFEITRSIRMAVDTGKVLLGVQETHKNALSGKAKLVIISDNCPPDKKQDLEKYCKLGDVQVMVFKGSSIELGTACGKPFPVSAMTVLEAGNSDVLEVAKRA